MGCTWAIALLIAAFSYPFPNDQAKLALYRLK